MDFETWTDKNGTQWKVAEMTTRQIKRNLKENLAEFDRIGNKRVLKNDNKPANLALMAYHFESARILQAELKRRIENANTKD